MISSSQNNNNKQNDLPKKIGCGYPFIYNTRGGLFNPQNSYDDYVLSKLKLLLSTEKGQRLLEPDFGLDLVNFFFQFVQDERYNIKQAIHKQIKEKVKKYIPQVDILSIKSETDQHILRVNIDFRVYVQKERFSHILQDKQPTYVNKKITMEYNMNEKF